MLRVVLTVILAIMCLTSNSQEVEPLLFADTSILEVELLYNFDELKRDHDSDPSYHSAQLRYKNIWGGMARLEVDIKTRGIFRRNPKNCAQPPLWIRFDTKRIRNTPFEGISKVKLVLQCYNGNTYAHTLLREYLAYSIYGIVSSYSYRVRLVRINLVDRITGVRNGMYGFFIEPSTMMATRLGARLDNRKNIHPNACNKQQATRMALFQYMIGHTDWSIKAQHNITLIELADGEPPIPVPFDFDFSGLVDAPYALPAEHLPIKSIKERHFNGYCRTLEDFKAEINYLITLKSKINSCIINFSLLDDGSKAKIIDYIEGFYGVIGSDRQIQHEFVEGCRTD